jgi:hypothetical protein
MLSLNDFDLTSNTTEIIRLLINEINIQTQQYNKLHDDLHNIQKPQLYSKYTFLGVINNTPEYTKCILFNSSNDTIAPVININNTIFNKIKYDNNDIILNDIESITINNYDILNEIAIFHDDFWELISIKN